MPLNSGRPSLQADLKVSFHDIIIQLHSCVQQSFSVFGDIVLHSGRYVTHSIKAGTQFLQDRVYQKGRRGKGRYLDLLPADSF